MAHGEASDESAHVTGIVPVVQMQDGLIAIIERGLFDALESQNLRVKVIVFLGTANAEGQMMVTVDMCIHTHGQSSGSVKRIRRSGATREVGGQRLQFRITDLGFAKERHGRNATTYHLFYKRCVRSRRSSSAAGRLPLVLDLQRNGPWLRGTERRNCPATLFYADLMWVPRISS